MNKQECDIMNLLSAKPYQNQRQLAEDSGYSLGAVNHALRQLTAEGYLTASMALTETAWRLLGNSRPKNAVILAAGYGTRMVPINTEVPKGLLEVNGEPLVERLIRQLRAVGIQEIHIVVGYLKERFDYLIDAYQVDLIVNMSYAEKNNLHSLKKALSFLGGTYIIPCDLWCAENPFRDYELYPWYMVGEETQAAGGVRVNRRGALVPAETGGNTMLGICYLPPEASAALSEKLSALAQDPAYDHAFWEDALFGGEFPVYGRVMPASAVVEINTYEQLRDLDGSSSQLQTAAISAISQAMGVRETEITDITVLKKGMTNRSFLFRCRGETYIMRIPGEGTDKLIDRKKEAAVYDVIRGLGICDDILYFSGETGYKITRYIENARTCDPLNPAEVRLCMKKLRDFHALGLKVEHQFDIFGQISYYESLWEGKPSVFRDYTQTRDNALSLRLWLDSQEKDWTLTHIDAVPDNFLFETGADGTETIRLIDWEYAGMQDPHVDIAMFCIYAMYDRDHVDAAISAYFPEGCTEALRMKIYCYIALCGLLWSNWCEYKRQLGVEFGEYALKQYRYAKDYYRIVRAYLARLHWRPPAGKEEPRHEG